MSYEFLLDIVDIAPVDVPTDENADYASCKSTLEAVNIPYRLSERPDRILYLCYFDPQKDIVLARNYFRLKSHSRFQHVICNMYRHDQEQSLPPALESSIDLDGFSAIIIDNSLCTRAYISTSFDYLDLDYLDRDTRRKLKQYHGLKLIISNSLESISDRLVAFTAKNEFDLVLCGESSQAQLDKLSFLESDFPPVELFAAEFTSAFSVQHFDDILEAALRAKGLSCKARITTLADRHILAVKVSSTEDITELEYSSASGSDIRVHRLSALERTSDSYQRRADSSGAFQWGARLKFWNPKTANRLSSMVLHDESGLAALAELRDLETLLEKPADYSGRSFFNTNDENQLLEKRAFLKHILDCTITIVDKAINIRGFEAIVVEDRVSLLAALLLKSIFKVPIFYAVEQAERVESFSGSAPTEAYWYELEDRLAAYFNRIPAHAAMFGNLIMDSDEILDSLPVKLDNRPSVLRLFDLNGEEQYKTGAPWTGDKFSHILFVVPDSSLNTNKKIVDTINGMCEEGIRVSILVPPHTHCDREALSALLHDSANIYDVPMYLKAAECYDLGKFLGRSPTSFTQSMISKFMDNAVERKFDERINRIQLPAFLRAIFRRGSGPIESILKKIMRRLADQCFERISKARLEAAERNLYWRHFRKHQLSPALYRKYEEVFSMDYFIYNYFYFIKALSVHHSVLPIDAVYCYTSYFWSLPVGSLLKEMLGIKFLYNESNFFNYSVLSPESMAVARRNESWMLDLVDDFIENERQEILQSMEIPQPTYVLEPSPVIAGAIIDKEPGKLNIAILYDQASVHIGTVFEYLNAFRLYLPHNVEYIPATANNTVSVERVDLSMFDVVMVHYSVRLSLTDYINADLAKRLTQYNGLKVLFIQDEYDTTETARTWMDSLSFDIVYTCVPQDSRNSIYPDERFPNTKFIKVLTGYVPEDVSLDEFSTPMNERNLLVCYRGRILPYHYGKLGYEKYEIGIEVRRYAEERGYPIDIEVDDHKRIYGSDWYRFVGSARATLGTESGSNVFDFDGNLRKSVDSALAENPLRTFEYIHKKFLAKHDGSVEMNQISPKIFEAIRLRTALILFEGQYSGVVLPDIHFIPLRKDYSNLDEIFEKLHDVEYLRTMTDRAYRDIIDSGEFSYQRFVNGVNEDIISTMLATGRSIPDFKNLSCSLS